MPIRQQHPEVVRLVEGVRGTVTMDMVLTMRFGYGQVIPWVRRLDSTLVAIAGPDGLSLWTPVHTEGKDMSTVARFTVSEGQRVPFSLAWFAACEDHPGRSMLSTPSKTPRTGGATGWPRAPTTAPTANRWCAPSSPSKRSPTNPPEGSWRRPPPHSRKHSAGRGTGTTGSAGWRRHPYPRVPDAGRLLPGGDVLARLAARAVAGDPSQMQIMYGPAGERRLDEWEVTWLPGYEDPRRSGWGTLPPASSSWTSTGK